MRSRVLLILTGVALIALAAFGAPSASALYKCPAISNPNADNHVVGTSGADVLCGFDGNDHIEGVGDNDLLDGGNGKDLLEGGEGGDALHGGHQADDLRGQGGTDFLIGDAGRDAYRGGGDDDCMLADDGVTGELINGGSGHDRASWDHGDIVKHVEDRVTSCG